MFAFLFVYLSRQEAEGDLDQEELDFFLKGSISLEKSARGRPYSWIPDQGWEDIIKLTQVSREVFGGLADAVERNESSWKTWFDSDAPEVSSYWNQHSTPTNIYKYASIVYCSHLLVHTTPRLLLQWSIRPPAVVGAQMLPRGPYLPCHDQLHHQADGGELRDSARHLLRAGVRQEFLCLSHRLHPQPRGRPSRRAAQAGQQDRVSG